MLLGKCWSTLSGVDHLQGAIADQFARGENGFFSKFRRFSAINYSEFSASWMMNSETAEDPARKATKLIVGALRFRQRALSDQLAVDRESGRLLDMHCYRLIFSRLTLSSLKRGEPIHEVTDVPVSEHIIIAIDGIYYKLQVLRGQQLIPPSEIHQQVINIIADARGAAAAGRVGSFSVRLIHGATK